MSYACKECGTVIMEDDVNICQDCVPKYTEAELKQAVKEEREACALICEQKSNRESNGFFEKSIEMVTIICAEAIRARATK